MSTKKPDFGRWRRTHNTLEIFLKFEKYFPRYKKMRYEQDKETRHKEKNYYSHIIMDAQ